MTKLTEAQLTIKSELLQSMINSSNIIEDLARRLTEELEKFNGFVEKAEAFANETGDQLSDVASEIEDEDEDGSREDEVAALTALADEWNVVYSNMNAVDVPEVDMDSITEIIDALKNVADETA